MIAGSGSQQQPTSNLVTLLRSRGLVQDVTSEELQKVCVVLVVVEGGRD